MNEETLDIWVCLCCMLMHANGECCSSDEHGGDGIEPWSRDLGGRVTMGLLRENHAEGCEPDSECDCETDTYSTSPCPACGSRLHGERHAFTVWRVFD